MEENAKLQKRLNDLDHLNLIISDPPLFLDSSVNFDFTSENTSTFNMNNNSLNLLNSNINNNNNNDELKSIATPITIGLSSSFFASNMGTVESDITTTSSSLSTTTTSGPLPTPTPFLTLQGSGDEKFVPVLVNLFFFFSHDYLISDIYFY